METVSLVILCVTTLVLVATTIFVLTRRNKSQLHYLFCAFNAELVVWAVAALMETLVGEENWTAFMAWENLTYVGSAFVPVTLLLLGLSYIRAERGLNRWHWALLTVPAITQVVVWTNQWHHLFYVSYSTAAIEVGPYANFHVIYSYVCMLLGLFFLMRFAVRNSGVLSVQAVLIALGNLIPLAVNVIYTLVPGHGGLNVCSTPTAFAITGILYLLAMFRFNLLKVTPVALQTVVNRISDSFVVVDTGLNIIDYNRSFGSQFSALTTLSKEANFFDILRRVEELPASPEQCRDRILEAGESGHIYTTEWHLNANGLDRYYSVEVTPIQRVHRAVAIILLFRDITQHVNDLRTIRENQAILLERERLASLGQLIGGIAHNLKTPIMSVAGGVEQLNDLVEEYRASIGDPEVTQEDHREIAGDMCKWLDKMKVHMAYMSDIISTVKDQASTFSAAEASSFTVDEMLKRIQVLMRHELVKGGCTLEVELGIDPNTQLKGDVNSLVQIFDNIIVNAIQSYQGRPGRIDLKAFSTQDGICFSVRDRGCGIPPAVQERLFKEMITTKGKHGTGLGLYMSHSTIKGIFRGNLWFESQPGEGTEFFISLPA